MSAGEIMREMINAATLIWGAMQVLAMLFGLLLPEREDPRFEGDKLIYRS